MHKVVCTLYSYPIIGHIVLYKVVCTLYSYPIIGRIVLHKVVCTLYSYPITGHIVLYKVVCILHCDMFYYQTAEFDIFPQDSPEASLLKPCQSRIDSHRVDINESIKPRKAERAPTLIFRVNGTMMYIWLIFLLLFALLAVVLLSILKDFKKSTWTHCKVRIIHKYCKTLCNPTAGLPLMGFYHLLTKLCEIQQPVYH